MKTMIDNNFKRIQIILSIFIAILTIIGMLIQIFRDPLEGTRLNTYNNLTNLVVKIINTEDNDSLRAFATDFKQMYGEVLFVANPSIMEAAKIFSDALEDKLKKQERFNLNKYKSTGTTLIDLCKKNY